ncbi:hypothetical protein C2W64_00966 [Brevibacillus laterosporus]|nr:hypothetical protein [Brevibacillus laterosporus]RAP27467.1 hypothetical protein C2W64_00966 [Brevibacillus laterosporus]
MKSRKVQTIIFGASFLLFFVSYIIVNTIFGILKTQAYTPNIEKAYEQAGTMSSSVTIYGESSLFTGYILPIVACIFLAGVVTFVTRRKRR